MGRAVLEEDPPRADLFPFPAAAAFFARSKAVVLLFTIVAGKALHEPAALGQELGWRKGLRRKKKKGGEESARLGNSGLAIYKGPLPSG